jgi:starch phosphorylase
MIALDDFVRTAHIAYFTMEIALRPEIHTYSGGLGVLAGDTARTCADLDLPVAFVTLISRAGYLRQTIDAEGRQVEHPDPWRPEDWVTPLGAMVMLEIEGRAVWVRAWLYNQHNGTDFQVPVILLDTDVPENDPRDREITHYLYGGEQSYRLKQEMVLGIGGTRILRALGFDIHTFHMNEGHAAFLSLELLRNYELVSRKGITGEIAYDVGRVRNMCIFTTHTPVHAGFDRFPYPMVEEILGTTYFALDQLKLLAGDDSLNMTRLALNLSGYVNGVAKRHAETSRNMFPGYRVHAITNGVHAPTWVSPSFARLYDKYVPDWRHEPELLIWADKAPDREVWEAHQTSKRALIAEIEKASGVKMDPEIPLLGFARRMTGYKRADLMFQDLERLQRIYQKHPFQLVLAGKAHPRDGSGKKIIEDIHQHLHWLSDKIPVAYLPNYDTDVAAFLVSGCDVWLNTPLPPLEASGTSGMKAAINGLLNLSVLDGWWYEACIEGTTGWAIGDGSEDTSHDQDSADLYEKLEKVVLPLYYGDRDRWIWMMKQTVSKIGSYYNSHRMMRRYAADAYIR